MYFDTNFGVGPETVRSVLGAATSRGATFAELYFQHRTLLHLGLRDHLIDRATKAVDLGVGVRVVEGDRVGYAFTEDLSAASMLEAARTAASIASGQPSKAPADLTPTTLPSYYDTSYDWGEVELPELLEVLRKLDEDASARDDVEKVSFGLRWEQNRIMIVDSDGRWAQDCQPMTVLTGQMVMNRNEQRQSNSYNLSARQGLGYYDDACLTRFLDSLTQRTRILYDAVPAPSGELPVVLAAGSSGILLHEAIGHGMEADYNRKGTSIFSDKIGKKVAHDQVTIVDSGVDPRFRGSINVDDEGNLPESTLLVDQGILAGYMHDRMSAAHYGVAPTGSGRRQSFRHAPLPRMRNTYMQNGPHDPEEIISSVKHGIYAETFLNGQVKIGAGDYTFYVKNGYLIEDGKLTAPIKDVNIIGNGPESLERISMVGNDFTMDEGGWTCGKAGQGVPVSLGLPTVLVSSITVGGQA